MISFSRASFGVPQIPTVSDNFNRADQNPISSPWIQAGTLQLPQLLNSAVSPILPSSFCVALYSGLSWPNDQFCQARIIQLKPGAGFFALVLRCDAVGKNFYYIDLDADVGFGGIGRSTPVNLQKFVGGVIQGPPYANLGTIVPQIGDVILASIVGSTISVYQNNNLIGSFTDPTPIASGSAGLIVQTAPGISAATDVALDDWAGGPISSSTNKTYITFPGGNSNGNLIVVGIFQPSSALDSVASISDTEGNIYFKIAGSSEPDSAGIGYYAFYGAYVTNGGNGVGLDNIITVVDTSSPTAFQIIAAEYSGIVSTNPLDVSSGSGDDGANALSYTIALSLTGELIVSMAAYQSFVQNWSGLSGVPRAGSQTRSKMCFYDTIANLSGINTVTATDDGSLAFPAGFSIALIPFNPSISGPRHNYGSASGVRRFGNLVGG